MIQIRLSLNEHEFSELCLNKYVTWERDLIPVNLDLFNDLISGDIIDIIHNKKFYRIALQDIGFDRIYKYITNSKYSK